MTVYTYDGSYEGLLSVILETYRLKSPALNIVSEEAYQPGLFGKPTFVLSRADYAERVQQGIEQRCEPDTVRMLYHSFLSEHPEIEMLIYRFVVMSVERSDNVSEDYREPVVLKLHQLDRQVHREVHRMHAFVRFAQTTDGLYVSIIEPDFNVLPLLPPHFQGRYPAFRWLIYDRRRHYGIYHEDHTVRFVTFAEEQQKRLARELLTSDEADYQALWKTYFHSVDIPERRNMKLHLRHVPRRYWKYLVEKQ